MLRVTSEKTYRLIKAVLLEKRFRQRELARRLKISPSRVNEVTQWLVRNNLVEKYRGSYEVLNPMGIVKLFTYYRSMEGLRVSSMGLRIERGTAMDYLKEQGAVFCLTTALQEYSAYFRDPVVNCYLQEYDKARAELKKAQPGLTTVNIYKPDLFLSEDMVEKDGARLTSKLRTVIDLFCDNKAHAAKELVLELWGVELG